jgi:hypothetical protein
MQALRGATDDGVVPSFGIREVFPELREEFGQASVVLKFECDRVVSERELVVN